jgi:hypothetical protein
MEGSAEPEDRVPVHERMEDRQFAHGDHRHKRQGPCARRVAETGVYFRPIWR